MGDIAEFTITIAGDPVPKGRPRFGAGKIYTPEKTRRWEQVAAMLARQKMAGESRMEGPLEVVVVAEWPIPMRWPKWKREAAEQGCVAHTAKPDADNVLKAAVDALNGVVFRDDSQLVGMIVRKAYSASPGVTIRIREIDAITAQETQRKVA
jgi:Holliday junction resolvase RusA-like endonuclease